MNARLHDEDFHTWTGTQAGLLRQGRRAELDTAQLLEALEARGARERRELANGLTVLLAHLLEWTRQPDWRGNGWWRTIQIQRSDAADVLDDNHGLRPEPGAIFGKAYAKPRLPAANQAGLGERAFPANPPCSVDQVMSPGYRPE
ncbi:DUF29 domain-containing protein [Methylococcus capsulatus]|nr:DUF29 domain-containing protein [Methylococcus capsulatus]